MIRELEARKESLLEELKTINTALQALQKLCFHDWRDDGHDSHYIYKKCKKCGLSERYGVSRGG
jgi:hypothetical protein